MAILNRLQILSLLMWMGSAMADTTISNDGVVGTAGQPDSVGFQLTFVRGDGEKEIFLSHKQLSVRVLTLVHPTLDSVSFVQVADGKILVEMIFDGERRLRDCDLLKSPEELQRFFNRFLSATDAVVPRSVHLGLSKGNGTAGSSGFRYVQSELDVDEDIRGYLRLKELKRVCSTLHKSAKELLSRAVGNGTNRLYDNLETRRRRSVLIWPGTNWCGKGNSAKHLDDMGENSATDSCCKRHDQCPYIIEGFQTRFNLFNYRFHTLSHCECDEQFRQCLKEVNDGTANVLGKVYFNVVSSQCFDLKLDKVCSERSWWGKCQRRELRWVAGIHQQENF